MSTTADQVIYQPPYGAPTRTVNGRLQDIVSVLDFSSFAAAVANPRRVWVPAGAFEVSTSLTVNADLIFDEGATLSVDPGVTLTLAGHVDAPLRRIFTGAGAVLFPASGRTPRVPVEWFGARDGSGTDAAAVNRTIAACRGGAGQIGSTVYFSSYAYQNEQNVQIAFYPDVAVASEPGAHIEGPGAASSTNGPVLTTGNYVGTRYSLPSLASFATALTLDRANLADVSLPFIQSVTNGIDMNISGPSGNASAYTLLDNKICCHYIAQASQNAILFTATQSSDTSQSNEIYVNFVTSALRACLFYGPNVSPSWDSNKIVIQAIDPNQIDGASGLVNVSGGAVSRCVFRCETWFGGFPSDGAFVNGNFNGLDIYLNYANGMQNYGQWALTGVGNVIRSGYTGNYGSPTVCGTTSNARGSFNGGAPITSPNFAIQCNSAGKASAGAVVTYYAYSPYMTAYGNVPRVTSVDGQGFAVNKVASTSNPNEIAISLINVLQGTQGNAGSPTLRVEFMV